MARPASSSGIRLPIKVWDLPTRLFHWAMVACLAVSYVSVTLADGPHAATYMEVHIVSGEILLGLVVFRLIWGFLGSETARFAGFLRSPAAALRHLADMRVKEPDDQVGHNAAGGWMVIALLLLLALQIGSGLFSNNDSLTEGPLAQFVSKDNSDLLSTLHGFNFNLLVAALAVHLGAIALYAVLKGHRLTPPMITGKKRLPAATRAPRMAHPLLACLAAAAAAALALVVARLG
jgi:cytochrome b